MMDKFCLINLNGRIYDPLLGRFLSPDTIVPNPTNGLDLNRYAYTENNPMNAIDPTGHSSDPDECPSHHCYSVDGLPCYGCSGPGWDYDMGGFITGPFLGIDESWQKDEFAEVETVVVTGSKVLDDLSINSQPFNSFGIANTGVTGSSDGGGIETVVVTGHRIPPPSLFQPVNFDVNISLSVDLPVIRDTVGPVCTVSKEQSIGTGALVGASTAGIPHFAQLTWQYLQGTPIPEIAEGATAEEVGGALAIFGGPVAVGSVAITASTYAYDRYSGGAVTKFLGKIGLGGGC